MKKAIITTLMLLASAAWAVAQSYPSQTSQSSSSDQTKTIQGCLSRSDGGYTLTDKAGTAYQVTGETAQLSDHVGHEVQIKGRTTEAKTPGEPSATTKPNAQPSIDVSSVKHISDTCKPKSESQNPPTSEKPPK